MCGFSITNQIILVTSFVSWLLRACNTRDIEDALGSGNKRADYLFTECSEVFGEDFFR
jgi:hypothetical protein